MMRTEWTTRWMPAAVLAAVLAVAFAVVFVRLTHGASKPASTPTPVPRPTPVPSIVPSPLDGLPVPRAVAKRRPLAIMVENFDPDARPQSGLRQASVVFETLAEGGITRFMAVYLDHDAGVVGPVRSARPYFVDWAAGLKAIFAHAGGSPDAQNLLARLSNEGGLIADIYALGNLTEFYRTTDRVVPHNLYTTVQALRRLARRRHWDHVVSYPPFHFKRPLVLASRRPQRIHISFNDPNIGSPTDYDVDYRYSRKRNVYWRRLGGVPHIDRDNGHQIAPTNVVVLFMGMAPIPGDPDRRITIDDMGHGRALYFHDGLVQRGTWRKPSMEAELSLLAADGRPERLDPGQTWIEAVPLGGTVTYGP